MNKNAKTFIISRTDSIGDVVLTLPVAGVLKELYPNCFIYFLGQKYTQSIIESCSNVDVFLNWTELQKLPFQEQVEQLKGLSADEIIHVFPRKEIAKLAKSAGITLQVGTTNRWFHWFYCNKRIKLSRKNSPLHETQLNLKLIEELKKIPSFEEISSYYGLKAKNILSEELKSFFLLSKKNVILHPKSKGSAREWGLQNYAELIELLPKEQYHIFLTGTEEEGKLFRGTLVNPYPFVTDLSGRLSLDELISVIDTSDALVACSTGPLHIAAALGKQAIGIYPPIRPMHPGRWAPIGKKAHVLVLNKTCEKCRKSADCECIRAIKPEEVLELLLQND